MSRFSQKPEYYSDVGYSDLPIITGGLTRVKKLNIYYIDLNVNYTADQKGLIVYDTDAVKNQISNILATPLGSDDFEPTYGSNLPYRLYDPITASTAHLLYTDTISALKIWMGGRIIINQSAAFVRPIDNDPDSEGYEVRVPYQIAFNKVIAEYSAFVLR